MTVAIAFMLALFVLWAFYEHGGGPCVQCGGRGKHRDGCPLK